MLDECEDGYGLFLGPHEFVDMEPEIDPETGENLNALAPQVCKHCGSFDIDCAPDADCYKNTGD